MSSQLEELARRIRQRVLLLAPRERRSHLSSALSSAEILSAIYGSAVRTQPIRDRAADHDRVILSKGHGAMALYAALVESGVCDADEISNRGHTASPLGVHPIRHSVAGIDFCTGSLGHGVALGAGVSLANSLRSVDQRVIVLLGDGECQEGSVWEAAQFAGHRRLNFCVVVDCNGEQQTGETASISDVQPLADRWRAFGWHAMNVYGHDPDAVAHALADANALDGPTAVIAATDKGRGLPAGAENLDWHRTVPRGLPGVERTHA